METPRAKTFNVTFIAPDGHERTVPIRSDEHIWDAAYRASIHLPALCHQGWCLSCAAHIEGQGAVDQADSTTFYPQDKDAGFALLCTGKPCSDLRFRTSHARAMRQHRLALGLPAPYSNL